MQIKRQKKERKTERRKNISFLMSNEIVSRMFLQNFCNSAEKATKPCIPQTKDCGLKDLQTPRMYNTYQFAEAVTNF